MPKWLNPAFLLLSIWSAGITWLVQDHPFFWDTVQLGSKHAHHFYETGFRLPWLLPPEIDSGHPPTFGLYLAICWNLFGKTLAVSHWSIFPFLLAINYLLLKIGRHFSDDKNAWLLPVLAWADPVFASQAILVSPDIPLVAFFLLAVWGILSGNARWLGIAVVGLGLISMRGMMVGIALYLWRILAASEWRRSHIIHKLRPFLPGGLAALGWLIFHYHHTGWVGFHADSPWSESFEPVSISGLWRNLMVCVWRMLDFGRVFIWLILIGLIMAYTWKGKSDLRNRNPQIKGIALLAFSLALVLFLPALAFKSLSAHRYLLPIFFAGSMLVWLVLLNLPLKLELRKFLLLSMIIGLATGNLWRYPEHISTGWDSTLAHWPYYGIRQDALAFIRNRGIPLEEVGTAFPEIGPLKYRDLSRSELGLKPKDLQRDTYILWSNIMNDFSDEERTLLQAEWKPLMKWRSGAVRMVLYFNPKR